MLYKNHQKCLIFKKNIFQTLKFFFQNGQKGAKTETFFGFFKHWVVGQVLRSWVKHFASFLPTVLDILTSRLSVSICHFLDWQNINHYFAIGIMVFVLLRMIAELEWSEHLPSHHLLLIWLMIHGKLTMHQVRHD